MARTRWRSTGSTSIGPASARTRSGGRTSDGTDANLNFITGATAPVGLAVDGQRIYWTNNLSSTIGRANLDGANVGEANLDGTDANQNLITGTEEAIGLAVSVPVATVSPSAPPAFPATPQGELSAPTTVTVGNSGQRDLSITGLSFAGADPGDFIVASDSCLAKVAPGQSCQIGVSFAPQAQGPHSATLRIATTDYADGPLNVSLSGAGGPLPTGPQGIQGTQGIQGPQGVPGPQGVAGTIVCQNTLAAKILCAVEFAPGAYTTQRANAEADFTIKRANRVVAHGKFQIRNGHITTTRIRRLGHGRYTLTITVGHGRQARVLLHEAVVIH